MKLNLKNFKDIPKISELNLKAYKSENKSMSSLKSTMELMLRMSPERKQKKKNLCYDFTIKKRKIFELLTYLHATYFSRTLDLKSKVNIDIFSPNIVGLNKSELQNHFKKVNLRFDSGFFFSNLYDDEHYTLFRGKVLLILKFNKGSSLEYLKGLKNILVLSSLGMKYCIKKRENEKQNKKRYNKKK